MKNIWTDISKVKSFFEIQEELNKIIKGNKEMLNPLNKIFIKIYKTNEIMLFSKKGKKIIDYIIEKHGGLNPMGIPIDSSIEIFEYNKILENEKIERWIKNKSF